MTRVRHSEWSWVTKQLMYVSLLGCPWVGTCLRYTQVPKETQRGCKKSECRDDSGYAAQTRVLNHLKYRSVRIFNSEICHCWPSSPSPPPPPLPPSLPPPSPPHTHMRTHVSTHARRNHLLSATAAQGRSRHDQRLGSAGERQVPRVAKSNISPMHRGVAQSFLYISSQDPSGELQPLKTSRNS